MPCVNHPNNPVQAYCQHCGKELCAACVRTGPNGQIYCDTCLAAAGAVPAGAAWTAGPYTGGPNPGFPLPMGSTPNPSAAAVLGLIPGAGAFYNGQYFKGLIHVVVFVILVSIADRYGVFGLFVAAWILYQAFEAYHTAKARRDGHPLPDPFGLNEMGSWLNFGAGARHPNPHSAPQPNPPGTYAPPSGPAAGPVADWTAAKAGVEPPVYSAPYTTSWTSSQYSGPASGPAAGYPPVQPPYAESWTATGAAPDPYAPGYPPNYPPEYPSGTIPPVAPVPPYRWQRREPVFAVVLIGLGIIFLLQSMGFVTHFMHYIWPVALIGIGAWLIVRRVSDSQGGSK
jgi:hypothetical protein